MNTPPTQSPENWKNRLANMYLINSKRCGHGRCILDYKKLELFVESELSQAREEEQEKQHDWYYSNDFNYPMCRKCGIVMRRDGENKPCPGIVNITLRG